MGSFNNFRAPFVISHDSGGVLASRRRRGEVLCIIVHHTATRSPARTITALQKQGLSTHFEIDRDGTIHQYLDPVSRVAFHAGKRNSYSIGIDLTHLPGDSFPEVQVESLGRLLHSLCVQFGLRACVAPEGARYFRWRNGEVVYEALPVSEFGIFRHCNCGPTRCPDGAPIEAALCHGLEG